MILLNTPPWPRRERFHRWPMGARKGPTHNSLEKFQIRFCIAERRKWSARPRVVFDEARGHASLSLSLSLHSFPSSFLEECVFSSWRGSVCRVNKFKQESRLSILFFNLSTEAVLFFFSLSLPRRSLLRRGKGSCPPAYRYIFFLFKPNRAFTSTGDNVQFSKTV